MNIETCLESLRTRYDILAEIGQGGMGRVYRALDRQLGRQVAIKIPLPSDKDAEKWAIILARFRREGRTLARLSDPGILQIFDIGEASGLPFIVSEWIDGDALHRTPKPWDAPQIVTIASSICSALAHAHQAGVTHRDIKPANIILRPDGTPVLIDFGIARVAGDTNVTKTGAVLGTLVYLAPELLMGQDLGPSVDQYGLGCVFYELAVGSTWIKANTLHEILRALLNNRPTPILELRPDFDPQVAQVIERMIARDPKERFPTMEEAQAAWMALMGPPGETVTLPRATVETSIPEITKGYEGDTPPPEVLWSSGAQGHDDTIPTQKLAKGIAQLSANLPAGPSTDSITLGLTRRKRLFRGAILVGVLAIAAIFGPPLFSILRPTASPVGQMQSAMSDTLWDEFGGLAENALTEADGDPAAILERAHSAAAEGQPGLAIILYGEALTKAPKLKEDTTFLTNASEWAILGKEEAKALLIANPSEALFEKLRVHSTGAGYQERQEAINLLSDMGQRRTVDFGRVSIADLKDGPTCPIRQSAIGTIKTLKDKRAIPHLQDILAAPIHERFANSCLIDDAREALELLKTS